MSAKPLLELNGVSVAAEGTTICQDVSLTINEGETHILLGPNGSGKSSLLNAVMGTQPFTITTGTVTLNGKDITEVSITERARAGLGMALQRPPRLPGVTVAKLADAMGAAADLDAAATAMNLERLVGRDVNDGFSGGETKRWEVMKILLQKPRMALFDEPESGVDLEHVNVVGDAISDYLAEPGTGRGALIITHTGFILDHVNPTTAHLMIGGRIVRSGDAKEMIAGIREHGYAS